jgi:hypothetical protein
MSLIGQWWRHLRDIQFIQDKHQVNVLLSLPVENRDSTLLMQGRSHITDADKSGEDDKTPIGSGEEDNDKNPDMLTKKPTANFDNEEAKDGGKEVKKKKKKGKKKKKKGKDGEEKKDEKAEEVKVEEVKKEEKRTLWDAYDQKSSFVIGNRKR